MAIAHHATDIGRSFAQALRHESAARRLWASTHSDHFALWVLTEDIDSDTERRLYGLASLLHEWFEDASIRLHIINPRHYEELVLEEVLPAAAEEIQLFAA